MKLTNSPGINSIGYNTRSAVPVNDQPLTTIGFGTTSEGGMVSNDLMQVTVNYSPFAECTQFYGNEVYDDSMLCAGAPNKDSCQGDSGGPIFSADNGSGDIVGIVSWGFGCARAAPGVYTRVSNYQQWIEEAICCLSSNPPSDCASTDCSAALGSVSTCSGGSGGGGSGGGGGGNNIDDDWYDDDSLFPILDSDGGRCLSPDATALVETKGKVSMKDVTVGDKVMTASGEYKTVFTISHSHPDRLTSFVRVQTEMGENPLELTPLHMVFLQGETTPKPAKDVKIGDVVQTLYHGPQKVTNITVVTRNGFYNPVTMDGTIVVDGVIASTYASLNGGSYLEIAGRKWISFQLLLDMMASPFRAFCTTLSLDLCTQYQPSTVHSMMQFYEFWSKQNTAAQSFLLFTVVLFFGLTRIMLSSAAQSLAILAFVGMICYCLSTKMSVLRKTKAMQKSKQT